jgi:hypothetical protein
MNHRAGIVVVVCAYLLCVFLAYGCMIGDTNFHRQNGDWNPCPESTDYVVAMGAAIVPLAWPCVFLFELGHLLNEKHIVFGLTIKPGWGCEGHLA